MRDNDVSFGTLCTSDVRAPSPVFEGSLGAKSIAERVNGIEKCNKIKGEKGT